MSKRTVFTTITPLPTGITRETVLETLHSHVEMIDLNPLVTERHIRGPPPDATAEEFHCTWYSLTDRVSYFPGISGQVKYNACFHDLANGLQTHVFAPLGLDIKEKWSIGGSLPGEPKAPVELGLGVPKDGLYLREDCDMRCNLLMTSFVKGTLKKAHSVLVDRLVEKAGLQEVDLSNQRISVASSSPSSLYNNSTGFPSPCLTANTYSPRTSVSSTFQSPQPPPTPQPSQTLHPNYAELAAPPMYKESHQQYPAPNSIPTYLPRTPSPQGATNQTYMPYEPTSTPSNGGYAAYQGPPPPLPPKVLHSTYQPPTADMMSHDMPLPLRPRARSHSPHAPAAAPVEMEG